jgi:hypothetical protein
MKRTFKLVSMIAISATVVFSSCSKKPDEVVTPQVTVVNSYSAVLLGAQSNASPAFFASSTGVTISSSNASANASIIDISYAELGSPTVSPYLLSAGQRVTESLNAVTGGTSTFFKESTDFSYAKFDTLTNVVALNGITASTTQKVAISNGKVYEFVNAAGKKGLIYISSLSAGTSSANGSVTLRVKVQK